MTPRRPPLLVLHEYGDERAGAGWQPLVATWPALALAPDLPGHGETPLPEGGKLVPSDLQLYAVRVLREAGVTEPPVAVGHGP